MVQNDSGMGDIATMAIPSLQAIDTSTVQCQALIITSTRNLAMSLLVAIRSIATYMAIDCHACVGISSARDDVARVSKGCQVLLGTPGRILDLINRRAPLEHIKLVILYDADELLSRGFEDTIDDLTSLLPSNKRVVILSCTIPEEVIKLTDRLTRNSIRIVRKKNELQPLRGVKQFYVDCEREDWKLDTLHDAFELLPITQALIFCNTDRKVDWLAANLRESGHTVQSINSNTEQAHRGAILKKFRTGEWRFLIATDLPNGRLINARQVMVLVINFDMPIDKLDYIRRLSRFVYKTTLINFLTVEDRGMISELEKFYSTTIPEAPLNLVDFI